MITTTEADPVLSEAWTYVHGWAEKTMSERVRNNPEEDGLIVAAGFFRVDNTPRQDGVVGRVSFTALRDNVEVELYDSRRILQGVVPHHPNGMPMQGLLSTRRCFEDESSLTHIGVNGELYKSGAESGLVSPNPMDQLSKLAVLAYFEARVEAATNSHR